MGRIEITGDAERDLIEIYLHGIELFGHNQAERYLKMLSNKIDTIAENPGFGIDYDFVSDGLRRYESSSHSIYYNLIPKRIRILRILHTVAWILPCISSEKFRRNRN